MANKKEPPLYPMLNLIYGTADKKPRPLDRDAVIIGRARGCDICLEAPDVSSLHCVITRGAAGPRVRDCGSRAGIKVNGQPVQTALLHDGDLLQIGPFSFQVAVPPEANPKPAEVDPNRLRHLEHCRRRLVQLALKWRRRQRQQASQPLGNQADGQHKADQLRERIRSYDLRFNQLEEAERELAQDRDKIKEEREELRARVQKVEEDLANRCQEVEKEIHHRWQEFQKRCEKEDQDRRRAWEKAKPQSAATPETSADLQRRQHELESQAQRLADQEKHVAQQLQELARRRELLQQERHECLRTKDEWHRLQTLAESRADQDRQAWTQAELLLSQERQELARMLAEFQQIHTHLEQQQHEHHQALLQENEQLQRLLAEREQQQLAALAAAYPQETNTAEPPLAESEDMAQLRRQLQEMTALVEQLQSHPGNAMAAPATANDLESYEAELNHFRQQLEKERHKVKDEREQLQLRQLELDEATREMEMEMSRERAELARERIRLDRLREEIRAEMDKVQREGPVRENLVPVQKLREEIQRKQPNPGPPSPKDPHLEERLSAFRQRLREE